MLTEQRPRMQSRVKVAPLTQGDGVIFAVAAAGAGAAGTYRVKMRHGVSRLNSGALTLGSSFTMRRDEDF